MALCAGIGGLELGLEIALPEYRCVCYVEREAYPAAILVSRLAEGILDEAPIWDDLETFDGRPWRGRVDIISAGFPCQPWSSAGRRNGTDDERWLWPEISRVVREVEPRWVFLENVPRLVDGGLAEVLRDLALCGFNAEWNLFSAAETGAPHLRERLFILAHTDGYRCYDEGNGQERNEGSSCIESGPLRKPGIVTDTSGGGWSEGERHISSGKSYPNRCDQEAPDTDGDGCQGEGVHLRRRRQEQATSLSNGGGSATPNPNGSGFQILVRGSENGKRRRIGTSGREGWWGPEPPFRGVDDGTPYRVDRLRACGNAVVPAVAARAFTELRKHFR